MRKMNKIVALSLVLAMALSMMASAASFKDQATINEDLMDEINLLVALGVYSEQGTGAGYFEPNGTITRAQAAKIIYVLKNKGVDNGATSWTGLNIFNDVEAGAWYEGYVNYCASVGILAGTGDNKFTPNGQLTGVELAKMLLVVIGYKADVEGYTGDKWATNIISDAEAAGIFVDYELPVRGIVTREWAAQMIVNALNATKVKYEDGQAVEMYDIFNEAITYAEQDLGLLTITGQLTATPNVTLGKGADNENGKKDFSVVDGESFDYDANLELLGQEVNVLVKTGSDKVYGITANEKVVVLETTLDEVDYDEADFADNFEMYVDYVEVEAFDVDAFGANLPYAIKFIDNNDDGKWDIGMMHAVAYDEVTYHNPAKNTIRTAKGTFTINNDEDEYAEIVFADTVEKGDMIKVSLDQTSGKLKYVVELLDVVTGAVTKVTSGGVATIDGGAYEKSDYTYGDFTLAVNKTAKEYFVDGKYVVWTDAISTTNEVPVNLAIVTDMGEVAEKDVFGNATEEMIPMVEVVLNNGTQGVYEYDVEIDDAMADYELGVIYEYAIEDGKIGLIAIDEDFYGEFDEAEFDKSEAKFDVDGATYLANDDTFFFVYDEEDDEFAVVSASEIKKDATLTGANFVKDVDGFNYVVAAIVTGVEAEAEKEFGIAAGSYTEEIVDDDSYFFLEVTNIDGTVVTLKLEEKPAVAYKWVEYSVDSEGIATVAETTLKANGFTTFGVLSHVSGNAVVINDSYMELADDVEIYYIDAYKTSADKARISVVDGDELVLSAEDIYGNKQQSVIYGVEDGEIAKIIVEVDGEAIWKTSQLNQTIAD